MSFSNKHKTVREAELAQRRGIATSDKEWSGEEDVSPPDVSVPSTSGVRIREDVILRQSIRVAARPPADPERERIESDDVVEFEDVTEVEEDKEWEEMEGVREESEREESDPEPPTKLPKKRGRGRPATIPGHAGQFTGEKLTARSLARKERALEKEQRKALDPATEVREGPRLAKARREELELLMEFRETSAAGFTAVMTEQIALLRKVAQRCSNLKGMTVKALWDATVTIAAASAALNLRAQSSGVAVAYPEWEDMREELRQLCADMFHLRASNETLKEDLKRGQAVQERLKRELEREREERRDKERERKEEERGEERNVKKPLQQPPPRDSSPVRLRPRTAQRSSLTRVRGRRTWKW